MKNGKFVVIEGGHGTGKTTLARNLKKRLEEKGFSTSLSKEPYSKEISKLISKFSEKLEPIPLHFLLLADRAIHVKFIKQQQKEKDFTFSVRYVPSSLVYQRISGINKKTILQHNAGFPKPEKMILLHCDIKIRRDRIRKDSDTRKKHYFLKNKKLQLEQKYYSELCKEMKKNKHEKIIDVSQPMSLVSSEAFKFLLT